MKWYVVFFALVAVLMTIVEVHSDLDSKKLIREVRLLPQNNNAKYGDDVPEGGPNRPRGAGGADRPGNLPIQQGHHPGHQPGYNGGNPRGHHQEHHRGHQQRPHRGHPQGYYEGPNEERRMGTKIERGMDEDEAIMTYH